MKSYTLQNLQERFLQLNFRWPNFHLIGIRSKADIPNEFDDIFYAIIGDRIIEYKGTTNPGDDYLLVPMNSKGAAILDPDRKYNDCWELGLHRGTYEAFVQCRPVTVWRDNDKDLKSEEIGIKETGMFGIDIHRYAKVGTFTYIDNASAGCQVFYNPIEFEEFKTTFKLTGLRYLTYTLLREY